MFCHPIPGLNHSNILYYIDFLRQDENVGNRVDIFGAGVIGFDTKRWMEDWEVGSTNEARAGGAADVPSQRRRARRKKRKKRGGERGGRRIVLMQRKVGNMGNLGRTKGYIHREELVKSGRVHDLTNGVGYTLPYS